MNLRTLLLGLLAFASPGPAFACTICHSPGGLGVRHQLFEHDFLANAAAIAAPIPILLAAVLWVAREPHRRRAVP